MTAAAAIALPQRLPVLAHIQWPAGACGRCIHGVPSGGKQCQCPAVTGGRSPVPVDVARARGGSCGLDAWHHDYHRPTC